MKTGGGSTHNGTYDINKKNLYKDLSTFLPNIQTPLIPISLNTANFRDPFDINSDPIRIRFGY